MRMLERDAAAIARKLVNAIRLDRIAVAGAPERCDQLDGVEVLLQFREVVDIRRRYERLPVVRRQQRLIDRWQKNIADGL